MCGHQVLTVTLSYLLNLYFHVPNPSLSPPSLQASTSYLNELSPCSRHWVCIVAVPLLKVWTLWATRGFVSNVWLSVLFLLNQELIRAGPNIAVIWRCAPPVHGCAPRPLVMWRLPGSLCLLLAPWNVDVGWEVWFWPETDPHNCQVVNHCWPPRHVGHKGPGALTVNLPRPFCDSQPWSVCHGHVLLFECEVSSINLLLKYFLPISGAEEIAEEMHFSQEVGLARGKCVIEGWALRFIAPAAARSSGLSLPLDGSCN